MGVRTFAIPAILILCSCNVFKLSTPVSATVSYVNGKAVLSQNGQERPLSVGSAVAVSDRISTPRFGTLDLIIKGFGIIKLGPSTEIELLSLDQKGVSIGLRRGDLVSFVQRQDKESRFSVETPAATAQVRGTAFLASVAGETRKKVKIAVLSGAVSVVTQKEDIFLDRGLQLSMDGGAPITGEMVQPVSPLSLREIQNLAVLHPSLAAGFQAMADEIRRNIPEIEILEEGYRASREIENVTEAVPVAGTIHPVVVQEEPLLETHLTRDVDGDPLYLTPSKSFDR